MGLTTWDIERKGRGLFRKLKPLCIYRREGCKSKGIKRRAAVR